MGEDFADDAVWNGFLAATVRGVELGHFRFSMKRCGPQSAHGTLEALCPYHMRNAQSGCKKAVNVRDRSEAHVQLLITALQHWCNRARSERRQRGHKWPLQLDIAARKTRAVVRANLYAEAPPRVVLPDDELDAAEAMREGEDPPAVMPKAKAKGQARPKARPKGAVAKLKVHAKCKPAAKAKQGARAPADAGVDAVPAVEESSSSSSSETSSDSSSSSGDS